MKRIMLALIALLTLSTGMSAEEPSTESTITCDPAKPCWICEPTLREKGRLWCTEHTRYEDRCWICHPDMQDKKRLYCGEHGIYEDECTLCHPELAGAEKEATQTTEQCGAHGIAEAKCIICTPAARQKGRLWCKEHTRYEDRCWLCHPEMEDTDRSYCDEHHLYEDECVICRPEKNAAGDKQEGAQNAGPACDGHGIAAAQCILCTPAARQKGRLWCKEHTRYEDRCWLCHEDMKDADRPYCDEHHLYEDECFYCKPALLEEKAGAHKHTQYKPGKRLECREHTVFEDECAICHPDLAPGLAAGEDMKIRFVSKASASKAGVTTASPATVAGGQTRKAYAELSYNANRLAMITPLAGGVIKQVLVDVGDQVEAGTILAELASTEVAEAKRRYLESRLERTLAAQEQERQKALNAERIAAQRDVQKAEAALARADLAAAAAKQALINLGLTEQEVASIAANNDTSARLLVRAPFAGTIIERSASQGAAVEAGSDLLTVANLSTMWLDLSVSEDALQELRVGQPVQASFPALGDIRINGTLTWIANNVDKRSRLVRARALVPNPTQLLRSGLYGDAVIAIGESSSGIGVPRSAIQRLEQQPFVFVRQEEDLYLARRVDLGPRVGDHYLVKNGLHANDAIVVAGTHVVYSEMMKSRLGAGCVDD